MVVALIGVDGHVAQTLRAALPEEELLVLNDPSELERRGEVESLSAVIVDGGMEGAIRSVQLVQSIDKAVPGIVLAHPDRVEALRKTLLFTPLAGDEVRLVDTANLAKLSTEVSDAIEGARIRRHYRDVLRTAAVQFNQVPVRPQATLFLGQLLDHAPIGVVVVDRSGSILACNRAASAMLRRRQRGIIGQNFLELLNDEGAVATLIDAAFEGREPGADVHEDAGYAFEVIARSVTTADRERAVMALLTDVTAKVEAESRSRDAIARLSMLAHAGRVLSSSLSTKAALKQLTELLVDRFGHWSVVYIAGPDGCLERIAAASSAAAPMAGRELLRAPPIPAGPGPAEVLQTGRVKVWDDLGAELAAAGADPAYVRRVKAMGIHAAVALPLTARGRSFGVLGVSTSEPALKYSAEDVALLNEIAGRASIALDNASLYEGARLAEARLRTLINNVDAILWEARGEDRAFTFVSKRSSQVLGYEPKLWLEDDNFWQSIIDPEDRDAVVPYCRDATRRGADHSYEYRVNAADGRRVWIRDIVYVDRDSNDSVRMLRGIMLDVSEEKAAREELEHSHNRLARIATTLQQSLLPQALPSIPGLSLVVRYRPGVRQLDVGGDFYDAFPAGDGGWALSIGDVSGRGVNAAALTALARHTIRANVLRLYSPAETLTALNDAMLLQGRDEDFCTAVSVRLERHPRGFRTSLALGGHPPPLLVRANGEIETLHGSGLVLGALPQANITETTLLMEKADALVLFTDGVIEAGAPSNALDDTGLAAACAAAAGKSAEEIARAIEAAIERHEPEWGGDDYAILIARVD